MAVEDHLPQTLHCRGLLPQQLLLLQVFQSQKPLSWALGLPSRLKLDVTLMLLPGGETGCLPALSWTLAGAEDNPCLGLGFPATTNQEKRHADKTVKLQVTT